MEKYFANGEKITATDWKEIDKMVEKLELSIAEAIELRAFDKFDSNKKTEEEKKKPKTPPKKKISEEEVQELFNLIKIKFKDEPFQNKNFHLLVADKYSNRQTPSRLKKLVNLGLLEDLGGTPKKYKVKGL